MVVQHNLQAMNSNRMLGVTTSSQAKTTEKLSSGYKINRAADDAAGLSISEKMRKQIRGLDQASNNAQDGVSAVQTAEGALAEVHDMLQRMNELAVQSSNGTNSDSDRTAIQNEIDQLTTEIDRVAETTKFNETYLLKGDANAAEKTVNLKPHDAGLKGKLVDNGDGTATFTMDAVKSGDKVTIGGKEYTIGTKLSDVTDKIAQPNSGTLDIKIGDQSFKLDSAGAVYDESGRKLYYNTADGATAAATSGTFTTKANFIKNDGSEVDNNDFDVDGLKALVHDGTAVKVGHENYVAIDDNNAAKDTGTGISDADTSIITKEKAYLLAQDELLKANQIGDTVGNAKVGSKANAGTAYTLATADNVFSINVAQAKTPEALSFNLHVGADADMTNKIGVKIETMNSAFLGVKGLDVVGSDGLGNQATYAIDAIADAVQKVSDQRSALGAVQNRLEHTIKNLDNVVENTTAAESQIRDTDMASTMVEYTKNNILAQAGQSMLAQANQSTQGVLSLLG